MSSSITIERAQSPGRRRLSGFEWAYLSVEPFLPPLNGILRRRLCRLARSWPSPEILDVGGRKSPYTIGVPGRVTITDLERQTPQQAVLNLGVTDQMVAQTVSRRTNIHGILVDDITRSRLPDASFDCVVAVEVLEHVQQDVAFLEQVHRVLKPGGVFLMSTPNGDWVDLTDSQKRVWNPDHKRHYRRDELASLLRDYFSTVEVEYAIPGGRCRQLGLRPWSARRPFHTALGMVANLANLIQSTRPNVKQQRRGTKHLIASAIKAPDVPGRDAIPSPPMMAVAPPAGRPVVALFPRGEAIRNFVYSGALDLVARKTPVALLSVKPNAEIWQLLCDRYDSVDELPEIEERKVVWRLRELIDLAHGRWLWSRAAQCRWTTRDCEAIESKTQATRLIKKLASFPLANRPALTMLSGIERTSSRWLRTTNDAIDLFTRLKPSLVFNASHVHSVVALPSVDAAQALGIPTATFLFSWDNLTSQGRLLRRYDYYLVWNEGIRQQLLQIYPEIRPEQVFVTGTPQFDFHFKPELFWTREQFCARIGADPRRPIVFYATSMPRPVAAEQHIVEGIARMLRAMPDLGPPQLVVRVYAKDRSGRFDAIKSRCPDVLFPPAEWEPHWLTPKPEDTALLTNMLRHADLGINVASTVSLELCMFEKPVINVGYNPTGIDIRPFDYAAFYEFDHYRPVRDSGAVTVAWSEAEMPALIRHALRHPRHAATKQRALIERMFGATLDGGSADRVAATLLTLAEGRGGSLKTTAGSSATAAERREHGVSARPHPAHLCAISKAKE